jgi:hypothetical protein
MEVGKATKRNHLESELTTIEHGPLERIRLILKIRSRPFTRRDKILQDRRQKSFSFRRRNKVVCPPHPSPESVPHTNLEGRDAWLTVIGCDDVVYVLDQLEPLRRGRIQQGGVAQVMGHHYRRIERCEIECGDRLVVVSPCRFNDCCAFVLFVGSYKKVS